MTVFIRPAKRQNETPEQFKARDDAHWENVAKAEEALLKLREKMRQERTPVKKARKV